MADTEEIIARIRAKQQERENSMEVGIADNRRTQMVGRALREKVDVEVKEMKIGDKDTSTHEQIRSRLEGAKEMTTAELARRCHDRAEHDTTAKAEDILQQIRDRQKELNAATEAKVSPPPPGMFTDQSQGVEPVFKDWDASTISMVEEADDVDPFDYAMEMLEDK